MRKVIFIFFVLVIVSFTGCANRLNETNNNNFPKTSFEAEKPSEIENNGGFNKNTILNQIDKTEYIYIDDWFRHYAILVLSNNSSFDLYMTVTATFYNKDEIVGTSVQNAYDFDSGLEIAFSFDCTEKYDSVKYDYTISEYKATKYLSLISLEWEDSGSTTTVYATNNGTKPIKSVKFYALLFNDNNKLVDFTWDYCGDSGQELKPGQTQHAVVYPSGVRYYTAKVYFANHTNPPLD